MTIFYIVMLTSLILIIAVWNRVSDFKTAYLQALLFLEVMNIYDGIVIDKLWVGHSKFWILKGTEDIPFRADMDTSLKKAGVPCPDMVSWCSDSGRHRGIDCNNNTLSGSYKKTNYNDIGIGNIWMFGGLLLTMKYVRKER